MENADSRKRLLDLLKAVAYETRPCKFCGRRLYFVKVWTGKTRPYTDEGVNHFEDCPHFRRETSPAQPALFAAGPEAF